MKIITWNCNMAFRKKAGKILPYKPDILVVPECEHPDKLRFPDGTPTPTDMLWFGDNVHKGLGIFSYSQVRFTVLPSYDPEIKLVIPIRVTGGGFDCILFAIWANHPNDPDGQYVEQIWKALDYYKKHIKRKKTILIGDFNSNTIWDRVRRVSNHSNVVRRLEDKGIFSAYHRYFEQEQGKEMHPTLYMYRHENKPYHIDYCFLSSDFISALTSVEVGDYKEWMEYSDHVPVFITLADVHTNQNNNKPAGS